MGVHSFYWNGTPSQRRVPQLKFNPTPETIKTRSQTRSSRGRDCTRTFYRGRSSKSSSNVRRHGLYLTSVGTSH